MLIGELAERAGTSPRTLRYYEEQGLMRPRRDANGYRQYDDAELRVVTEIRARLAAGFGLEDIRPFVECLRAGNESGHVCPDSVVVLRRKLAEVDGYLDQLTEVRDRLRAQLTQAQRNQAQRSQAERDQAERNQAERNQAERNQAVEHRETRCRKLP